MKVIGHSIHGMQARIPEALMEVIYEVRQIICHGYRVVQRELCNVFSERHGY